MKRGLFHTPRMDFLTSWAACGLRFDSRPCFFSCRKDSPQPINTTPTCSAIKTVFYSSLSNERLFSVSNAANSFQKNVFISFRFHQTKHQFRQYRNISFFSYNFCLSVELKIFCFVFSKLSLLTPKHLSEFH